MNESGLVVVGKLIFPALPSPVQGETQTRNKTAGSFVGHVKKTGQEETVGARCPFLAPHALWLNPYQKLKRAAHFEQPATLASKCVFTTSSKCAFGGVLLKSELGGDCGEQIRVGQGDPYLAW